MTRDADGIVQTKYANSGDVGLGGLDLNELWPIAYSTPGGTFPQRIQFNQLFRYLSALAVEINQKGPFLEYNNTIDYAINASAIGSDGGRYRALIINGPASSIVNPVGDSTGTWILDDIIFTSMAKIRASALIPINNQIITLMHYYDSTDGGGGQFYWDAANTESDNGGTIIKVTAITTGRWIRIVSGYLTFKMFGIISDGSTDDTLAFQKMVDSFSGGETIKVSNGITIISNITGLNDVKLIGNKKTSIIKHKASSSGHMLEMGGTIEISGVQFDGNKDNQINDNFLMYVVADTFNMDNCILHDFFISARIQAERSTVKNNYFYNVSESNSPDYNYSAIAFRPTTRESSIKVLNNRFYNPAPASEDLAPAGIDMNATVDLITDCIVTGNSFDGFGSNLAGHILGVIEVYKNANNMVVNDNIIRNFYFTPIRLLDSDKVTVNNNIITSPGGTSFDKQAIVFSSYSHGSVENYDFIASGNIIDNEYGTGISVSGVATGRATITGNVVNKAVFAYKVIGSSGKIGFANNIASSCDVGYNIEDVSDHISIIGGTINCNAGGNPVYSRTDVSGLNLTIANIGIEADGLPSAFDCRNMESLTITGCDVTGTPTGDVLIHSGITRLRVNNNNTEKPYLYGSEVWDIPSLAAGATSSGSLTVTGCVLGDIVLTPSFSLDLSGIQLFGYVSASNTVTYRAVNVTTGTVDIGSGTIKVIVEKQ